MSARILDGKNIASTLRAEIAASVAALKEKRGVVPGLGVVLVGDNPASRSYVTGKEKEWDSYRTSVSQWELDRYMISY